MVNIEVVLYYFTDLFWNTSIMGTLTLMFHVCETIAVHTLMKMNAFVCGMAFKTPLALIVPSLFIVPPIS